MTEQSLIVRPQEASPLVEVDPRGLKQTAQMVKAMVTGAYGKALNEMQALQLAFISISTGLNPLTGELYMTDTGPQIGVLAYERKAQELLDATVPGTKFHIQYRKAVPGEDADFDPEKGDVGYVAVLTRDDWDARWQQSFQDFLRMLMDAGLKGSDAVIEAKALAGPKPYAEYAGVVDHRESFSGEYKQGSNLPDGTEAGDRKPEMMDRHERAKKRARKGVIKHEFPRLDIPDPLEVLRDSGNIMAEAMALPEEKRRPEAELLAEITGEAPEVEQYERPYPPTYLRERMQQVSGTNAKPSEGAAKALPGNLEALFTGYKDKERRRHTLLKFLFGTTSTKELSDGQKYALVRWMDFQQDSESKDWLPDPDAVKEAVSAVQFAELESGQMELPVE